MWAVIFYNIVLEKFKIYKTMYCKWHNPKLNPYTEMEQKKINTNSSNQIIKNVSVWDPSLTIFNEDLQTQS